MSLHSLPVFLRLGGRPVILIGEGPAAEAKRRLLDRAGAVVVGEDAAASLAIVALDDPDATVARLKARGVLVNAVDRPDLCDFTLPAIVERDPVIVAIGTGGASAGLAAALRQRIEALLPAQLSDLAHALHAARDRLRTLFPDATERRRRLGAALAPGGALDPMTDNPSVEDWLAAGDVSQALNATLRFTLQSHDPDDLTLRQMRALAGADRIVHTRAVPSAILTRARADAERIVSPAPAVDATTGLTVFLEMAE